MLKIVATIVVALVVALLGFAATRPNTFRVQRVTSIKAPPEKIFPLIADLHRWTAWSPYERKDPAMRRAHSGAASGPGAVYEWEGNRDIGKGRMEITEASPPARVTIKLDFVKPFEAHNIVEFTLEARGDSTFQAQVTDSQGRTASRSYTILVSATPPPSGGGSGGGGGGCGGTIGLRTLPWGALAGLAALLALGRRRKK